jgi:phage gp46-like protein
MPARESADTASAYGTVEVSPVKQPPPPGSVVKPTDLTTTWSLGILEGDWTITGGLFTTGQDLATAIILSIFTDAEAQGGDWIPDGTTDRRGWYSDDQDPVRMGSRLWLIAREKVLPTLMPRARGYVAESLQWMIDDGAVASFNIDVELNAPNYLAARVVANRRDGSTVAVNFTWAWQQMA